MLTYGSNSVQATGRVSLLGVGLGWGGIRTSLHLRSHALPHIRHATLLCFLMHFHTLVMLHCCIFSYTST